MRIFISYRREDSAGHAGRLADALGRRYGREHVFIDVEAIRLGSSFPDEIADAVKSSDVLIALIGRGWLDAAGPEGGRRLDDRADFVRREIETALAGGVPVVPVCVQGARIPEPEALPATLAPMTQRNGFELRDVSWPDDVASLVRRLEGGSDPPEGSIANSRWSAASAVESVLGLMRRLPPLEWEARPGIAALLGSVLGGIGTALYFRTLADILIGIVLAVPFVVATSMLPETDSPSAAAMPWWAGAMWVLSAALSGLYCILRAYSSNQRLEGAGRMATLGNERRDAVLARKVRSLVGQGWTVERHARFEAVVSRPIPNHLLHAILTFLSFGLWAPVWVTLASKGGEKRRAVSVDAWGNLHMQRRTRLESQPVREPEPMPESRTEPEPEAEAEAEAEAEPSEAESEPETATDGDSRYVSADAEHAQRARHRRQRSLALAVGVGLVFLVTVALINRGDGGGDEGSATHAQKSPSPSTTPSATVRTLLAMLPASIQDDCAPDETGNRDQLARVKCERWGATLYYALYRDALETRYWFSVIASIAREGARGYAKTCRDADARKPFVGTWTKPGGREAGQLVCTFDPPATDGVAERQWTIKGTPIFASALYAGDRQTATEGVDLAWREATR